MGSICVVVVCVARMIDGISCNKNIDLLLRWNKQIKDSVSSSTAGPAACLCLCFDDGTEMRCLVSSCCDGNTNKSKLIPWSFKRLLSKDYGVYRGACCLILVPCTGRFPGKLPSKLPGKLPGKLPHKPPGKEFPGVVSWYPVIPVNAGPMIKCDGKAANYLILL